MDEDAYRRGCVMEEGMCMEVEAWRRRPCDGGGDTDMVGTNREMRTTKMRRRAKAEFTLFPKEVIS